MTIEIEFRRHSIKDGPTPQILGPNGYRLARLVGEHQLRGRGFTRFFVSTFWRTHQTLVAFAEGAGDFTMVMSPDYAPIYLMTDDVRACWKVCGEAEKRGENIVETAFAYDQELALRIATDTAQLCRDWVGGMEPGTRALVIGHSPSMELMLFGLSGVLIPGLSECQGFRYVRDGVNERFVAGTPDLDPSELRKTL